MSEEHIGWLDDEWNTVLDQGQPIVRCRDCKNTYQYNEPIGCDCLCGLFWIEVEPDGFCAWGERREDVQ